MAVDFETLTDEEYFGHMKQMFRTEGWEILMEELRDQVKLINDVQLTTDEADLHFRKGQLAAIGVMMNFEATIQRADEDESPE